MGYIINGREKDKRKIPKAPSFRRIAANTIEPANGASTWALGNHIWKRKRGSFTIKAKIKNKYSILSKLEKLNGLIKLIMEKEFCLLKSLIIIRRRGSDLATV